MGLRITTNVSAIDTHRQMVSVDKSLSRSLERLSSGLRINRASDDAAGNAIADRLSTQVLGGQEAQKNIQDAIQEYLAALEDRLRGVEVREIEV